MGLNAGQRRAGVGRPAVQPGAGERQHEIGVGEVGRRDPPDEQAHVGEILPVALPAGRRSAGRG